MTPLQQIALLLVVIYGSYYVRMAVRAVPRWFRLRRLRRAGREERADLTAWAASHGFTLGSGDDPVLAEDAARAVALAAEPGPRGLGLILAGTRDGQRIVLVESWPESDEHSDIATTLLVETPVATHPVAWSAPPRLGAAARELVLDGAIVLSRNVRLDEASASALLARAAAMEADLRGSGATRRVVAPTDGDVHPESPDSACIQF